MLAEEALGTANGNVDEAAGLLLSGMISSGQADDRASEPDLGAGAMWAAATQRPARRGYADTVRPIPIRVQALCDELGIEDKDIEGYVISMLELEAYDPDEAESTANMKGIADLLASHCSTDADSILALLVSIGPFQ